VKELPKSMFIFTIIMLVYEQHFFEIFSNVQKLTLPIACDDESLETLFAELSSVQSLLELAYDYQAIWSIGV
jgi:hypothetical protein